MTSTNVRFALCDIDLNVEITPLPDLNIVVETPLTNQPIFDLEESYEDNLEEETKESATMVVVQYLSLYIRLLYHFYRILHHV